MCDDSFDDDSDPAFTPNQMSVFISTMVDILYQFQGPRVQRVDLNQTRDDFSEKLP